MQGSYQPGEPYCGNCGYKLTGLTESSKCPECGRPFVEVLSRSGQWGRRYRSPHTLFGLPLVDIALGPTPDQRIGHARGIIAIGDRATGLLAIGGQARGVVALGGVAIGLFSVGGISVGLIAAWGGLALGMLADGGLALGLLSAGGVAIGVIACGGMPVGFFALGGAPLGFYRLGPGMSSSEAAEAMSYFTWYFGPLGGFNWQNLVQPPLVVIGLVMAVALGVLLLAAYGRLRAGPSPGST